MFYKYTIIKYNVYDKRMYIYYMYLYWLHLIVDTAAPTSAHVVSKIGVDTHAAAT